jgi:hypothetical protein
MQRPRPSLMQRALALASTAALAGLLTATALAQATGVSSTVRPVQVKGWPGHGRDAQHTGLSLVAAQPLSKIHWKTRVDLHPPTGEIFIHYGSPLVTPAGTVIVPVKTGPNSFRADARNQKTGALLWQLTTGYQAPFAQFIPGFGPVLSHNKLYLPAAGGTVLVRDNPDQPTGSVSRLVFYGAHNFNLNRQAYQSVMINTPITADANGNIYFGVVVEGTTPIGLQSGLVRISATGVPTFVTASFAANDPGITKVNMSCAPALSHDGKILYVGVNSFDFGFGYLLALDSQTLRTITATRLIDPQTGFDADISDESSASPTVGPDGDVYFGVLEDPFPLHNDRGWLLHFNSDLTQQKIPGSFGWDDTPSIVPASMVPSYTGTSTYLLMSKYNNYANISTGDGLNKIAILDPNATEADPVFPTVNVMNEVLTIRGTTPDPNFPTFPGAVREWCINAAAVDPVTKSVLANSEDGKLYRWDLTTNSFSEVITLSKGIGEAYTPTLIGSDGTAFAINDAVLFAIGR